MCATTVGTLPRLRTELAKCKGTSGENQVFKHDRSLRSIQRIGHKTLIIGIQTSLWPGGA